jgi:hypothetical protein
MEMHARYEKKKRDEIQRQLMEAADRHMKDRGGRILKTCLFDKLREMEKGRKQIYVRLTMRVEFRNTGDDSPPKSVADLALHNTQLRDIQLADHAEKSTAAELKDTGERSFGLGRGDELWEQEISFSLRAPKAADLEKEFGKPEDKETCAESKGCFIATACYGSPEGRELDLLRAFRDRVLLRCLLGRRFVHVYYRRSPWIADWLLLHPLVRSIVRDWLISPTVWLIRPFIDRQRTGSAGLADET